jgi:hypothetical protein
MVRVAAALEEQVADCSDTEYLRQVWGLMKEMIRSSLRSKPGSSEGLSISCAIPGITLFDRPEYRFFEFLQLHVLRITHGV